MPARSVVLERLVKWNGETHADITPGEYTQLTGRAGRRGIDVEGHAVVLWQPGFDPRAVAGLAVDPHLSAALVASGRRTTWRSTWSASSAGDARAGAAGDVVRAVPGRPRVVGLARQVQRNEEALDGLPRGDDLPPRRLRRVRRAAPGAQGARGRAGPAGRRPAPGRGRGVAGGAEARRRHPGAGRAPGRRSPSSSTPAPAQPDPDGPRPLVLTAERQVKRLSPVDFPVAGRAAGPDADPQVVQPAQPAVPPRPRRRRCATAVPRRAARPAGAARRDGRRRRRDRPAARARSARTPATAATTARTTPAGPSGTTGCARETDER